MCAEESKGCNLLLTRYVDEVVVIGSGSNRVEVKIIGVTGQKTRLMITAPAHIPVHRKEIETRQLVESGVVRSLAGRHADAEPAADTGPVVE